MLRKSAFSSSQPNTLQIKFKNLSGEAYQNSYESALHHKVSQVQNSLNKLSSQRKNNLLSSLDDKISQAQNTQNEIVKQKIITSNNVQLSELNKKNEELEQKISNAESQKIGIKQLEYTAQSRGEFALGYSDMGSNANRMKALSNTFPIFFFAVALMVSFTVMRRMVEEKRIEIGTLKSLGYSSFNISFQFYLYASLTSVLATFLGTSLGLLVLPKLIFNSFAANYILNDVTLTWQITPVVIAFSLTLLSTVFSVFLAIRPLLPHQVAVLMLPKSPPASKKILLEKIPLFWSRLSFSHKVTARNIFRYKGRMWMTILGVAGSTAMLITGFGMQQSLTKMVPTQYGQITHYQLLGVFNSESQESDKYIDKIKNDKDIKSYKPVLFQNMTVAISGIQDLQNVPMIVTNNSNMSEFISLKSENNDKIKLQNDGITVNKKLAIIQNLSVGDSFTIQDSQKHKYKVKIANITKNYTGHTIYMSKSYYKKIFNTEYNTNAYLLKLKNSQTENKVSKRLNKTATSVTVIKSNETQKTINNILQSLIKVVLVIVILSGLLALIVLYTLTNINVSERIRELSTIKVLGFYPKEVLAYIYRETVLLTLAGLILGGIGGIFVHAYLMKIITPENVLSVPGISWQIYAIAVTLITVFTSFVAILMKKKIDDVDMLEALKSVD